MSSSLHLLITKFKNKQTAILNKQISNRFLLEKNPDAYIKREEVNENEQKPEKTEETVESEKWVLKPKAKPKQPTVRGKAKEVLNRNYKQQKAELNRRLKENTEKLEAIKKTKKNFQKKTIVLK